MRFLKPLTIHQEDTSLGEHFGASVAEEDSENSMRLASIRSHALRLLTELLVLLLTIAYGRC
jgi:hypothetical protein